MTSEKIETDWFDRVCAFDLMIRRGQTVRVMQRGMKMEEYILASSDLRAGVARLERLEGDDVEAIVVPASWVFADL